MEFETMSKTTSLSVGSESSIPSTPKLSPPASESSSDESSFFSALSSSASEESFSVDEDVVIQYAIQVPVYYGPKTPPKSAMAGSPAGLKFPRLWSPKHRPEPLALSPDGVFSPKSPSSRKLRKKRPTVSVPEPSYERFPPSPPAPTSAHSSNFAVPSISLMRRVTYQGPMSKIFKRPKHHSLPSIPSASYGSSGCSESSGDDQSERPVKFQSPQLSSRRPHSLVFGSPHPNRLLSSMSTDALTSLAWTGELPSALGSADLASGDLYTPFALSQNTSESGCWDSVWTTGDEESPSGSLKISTRPRGAELRRRWTLAAAITDEAISDEALVEQLENLRMKERMWQWERRQVPSTPFSPTMSSSRSILDRGTVVKSSVDGEFVLPKVIIPRGPSSPQNVSATWRTARRALLVCRELVRTERHYLDGLRTLACSDTATEPPPILLAYLPKLISISQALLDTMGKNPSAQGVSDAFLALDEDIESAFVSWCGVVGSCFVDVDGNSDLVDSEPVPIRRRVGSWGKRIQSLRSSPANSTVNLLAQEQVKFRADRVQKPTVRELAILPVQRITRYTLLYKDLHAHTLENSGSRASVESAMLSSISIAQKCNCAQEHAAFL